MDRKKQLEQMTVLGGLEPLARQYGLDIAHMKKGEIVEAIFAYENPEPQTKEIKRRPPRKAASTKLKAMRVKSGLTQKEVAQLTGINPQTYSQYEQGAKCFDNARLITIFAVCTVLECSLEDIIEDKFTLRQIAQYKDVMRIK